LIVSGDIFHERLAEGWCDRQQRVPSKIPPSRIIPSDERNPALTRITAVRQETYSIACPVKKMYL
jgi:hypothetical protein